MDVDQTVSVSKGVFVFKNNFKPLSKTSKTKRKQKHVGNYQNEAFSSNEWYQTYFTLWQNVQAKIEELNNDMFSSVLSRLVNFVQSSHDFDVEEIPTAALLTGINMPDHEAQFKSLSNQIKKSVTPHVAFLNSQDCQNIKYLIENMIGQFLNDDGSLSDEDSLADGTRTHLKKNQLNLSTLKCWYENLYQEESQEESKLTPKKQKVKNNKKLLVIIVSDFESFNAEVLQKFILITSCYIRFLPFVFIFGIATSLATLHSSLPYKVSSKIYIKVFTSQRSTYYLNEILEKVFFTESCPFQMGGKIFNLFIDIFLFYDLSVNNFIQNAKFAMAEHFSYGNAMALCSLDKNLTSALIEKFSHEDLENARHLLSFRKLVENETYENQIKLLTDDDYFANVLKKEIIKLQKYIRRLHIFLKCLLILVEDLPKAPLGHQLRDLYSLATSKNITKTQEYKECLKLLGFQSMEELNTKLSKILNCLEGRISNRDPNKMRIFYDKLNTYIHSMNNFNMDEMEEAVIEIETNEQVALKNVDRKKFKEQLLGMTKSQNRPQNRYEKLREIIISTLSQTFEECLVEPKNFHFHEIFFFNNISIQSNIIGSHRSAIHNALNDPQYYLQCDCCTIPNSSTIRPTMPDICTAYKLHLECGKMINLYDWLQAFLSIMDPEEVDDESKRIVNPELQARFTQSVAELEYLGFIKSTKRKADHVTRLTWGG